VGAIGLDWIFNDINGDDDAMVDDAGPARGGGDTVYCNTALRVHQGWGDHALQLHGRACGWLNVER
jgi:hypothetical protein